MINMWWVIFAAVVALAAIGLIFFVLLARNSFKASIASLLSSFTVLIGGLGMPDIDTNLLFDKPYFKSIGITVSEVNIITGIPENIFNIVLFVIAALLFSFGAFHLFDNMNERKYK